ncbi:hypothetical protein IMSAGC011_03105 [Lachnospiraceae bacterium]|nr:hypothetical protein IMSAGC011_03105 [Lachnospiraceae bacterium]
MYYLRWDIVCIKGDCDRLFLGEVLSFTPKNAKDRRFSLDLS